MLWTDCLTRLRQELSGNVFTMWIRPLVAEELNDTLRLYAPNPYWTRYIQEHHLELITIWLNRCPKAGYVKSRFWWIHVRVRSVSQ